MAPSQSDLRTLQETVLPSTLTLLQQFTAATKENITTTIENPPNPLLVLRDSAKLLKAHTTKISLLSINKPFTPSALTKVIREVAGTCLPAMMSAVQICEQEKSTWGDLMSKEVAIRVRRVFRELVNLLQEVQSIARGNGQGTTNARDSLSSTGVVWESCDGLMSLEKMGTAGLAVKKAEQYRDTIKDAIAELQEWKDGEDTENEGAGDELVGSDDEGVDGDADSVEDIFHAANSIPSDMPQLRALVEEAEGKLKKVVILYTALVKRRLKTFTNHESDEVEILDQVLHRLAAIPEAVDELASSFYDLDEQAATAGLQHCVGEARKAGDLARLDWMGKEDEFTVWLKKWEEALEA